MKDVQVIQEKRSEKKGEGNQEILGPLTVTTLVPVSFKILLSRVYSSITKGEL